MINDGGRGGVEEWEEEEEEEVVMAMAEGMVLTPHPAVRHRGRGESSEGRE